MSRTAAAHPRLLLPELDRLWIRYAPRPRDWREVAPPGELRWLDLASGELAGAGGPAGPGEGSPGQGGGGAVRAALPEGPFDDVLYLPPVARTHAAARDAAARSHAAEGTPVLVQVLAEDAVSEALVADGVVVVRDLFEPLLAGDLEALSVPVPGSPGRSAEIVALWPLVPGLTDAPDLVDEGCRRLVAAGFETVQGVAPDLPAAQRRQLYERVAPGEGVDEAAGAGEDDPLFHLLFHGPGADLRAFARAAHRNGLRPFLRRLLPRPPLGGAPEREAAGLLATAGEVAFRLGQVGRGQAHLRAARWIDRTAYDLRALARDGNLPVLHWLDPDSRRIVHEWAQTGGSESVRGIVSEYAGPE